MSGRRAARPAERLAAVYATVPDAGCKGLCQLGCGSIVMTPLEQQQIRVRHGVTLPLMAAFLATDQSLCPALTADGACSVYASRPLICRLYGAAEGLECPHGCVPEGGLMTRAAARRAMADVQEISGNRTAAARLRAARPDQP